MKRAGRSCRRWRCRGDGWELDGRRPWSRMESQERSLLAKNCSLAGRIIPQADGLHC